MRFKQENLHAHLRFKQAKPALASLRFKAKVTCSCLFAGQCKGKTCPCLSEVQTGKPALAHLRFKQAKLALASMRFKAKVT